ncbi:ATP-binding protein [Streptomyces millisiae]|uniref:ATP-binding protein n=1 Tax=Streptomyces millisiae TaxID=3075542 RepID=A0ABU2LK09_9ACTN|nr:ATP-binding protein [Streptomyces sp. DSM 44918]MDT0317920.1 ATP-binding protein [Streptomyces sp. DSM 44918]
MSPFIRRSVATTSEPGTAELLGSLTLDYAPRSPSLARRFVKIALTARGIKAETESLDVVVSELVTNSVMHARPATSASIRLRLWQVRHLIRVEVYDADPRIPMPRRTKPDDERGRGMYIIRDLAANQGFYRSRTGKCVWVDMDILLGKEE